MLIMTLETELGPLITEDRSADETAIQSPAPLEYV
jgi:hypothetical protein